MKKLTLTRSLSSFKELKNVLNFKKEEYIEKTDEEIFLEAMADVRERREFREIPYKSPPMIKVTPARSEDNLEVLKEIIQGKRKIRLSDTGEYREWTRTGTRKDLTKRLHQGDFSVQDYIDLHGLTLIEAEETLRQFFKKAVAKQYSCVKVIHGRGLKSPKGPVLKEALTQWLQGPFRKWVLAYATAKDCDGGLGATYVLLKLK